MLPFQQIINLDMLNFSLSFSELFVIQVEALSE